MKRSNLLVFVLGLALACGAPASEREPREPVRYERRIAIGDTIAERALSCIDDSSRTIGSRSSVTLLTFASPGDCSSCDSHLAGLDSIFSRASLPIPMVTVVYARESARWDLSRTLVGRAARPVCFDEPGTYWDELDLVNTPLTMLVDSGRIRYLHDGLLSSPEARAQFLFAIRRRVIDDSR